MIVCIVWDRHTDSCSRDRLSGPMLWRYQRPWRVPGQRLSLLDHFRERVCVQCLFGILWYVWLSFRHYLVAHIYRMSNCCYGSHSLAFVCYIHTRAIWIKLCSSNFSKCNYSIRWKRLCDTFKSGAIGTTIGVFGITGNIETVMLSLLLADVLVKLL